MGRRKKQNDTKVEVEETKGSTKESQEYQVVVNKKVIGTVSQKQGEMAEAVFRSNQPHKVRDIDEGIQYILMEYNLHDL